MSYRFRLRRPPDKEFRRVGLAQIDGALRQLDPGRAIETGIHEARKSLKRSRALVLLGRQGLGDERYRALNSGLRDAGRVLSAARDSHVLRQTLLWLETESGLAVGALQELGDAGLAGSQATSTVDETASRAAAEQATTMLIDVRSIMAGSKQASAKSAAARAFGRDEILAGFERCFAVARREYDRAYATNEDEPMHGWRKSVQRHWRQMQLLEAIWPEFMGARIIEAKAISDLIGIDHDLTVLSLHVSARTTAGLRKSKTTSKTTRQVLDLCSEHKTRLRYEARRHGERLMADGAGGLRRRLERYWRAVDPA